MYGRIVSSATIVIGGKTSGRYDDDKLLNIGANRWYIKPEIGMSIPGEKWSLEFSAGLRVFFDNNDYVGGVSLKQDPCTTGTGIGNDSVSYSAAWIYRWD